MLSVFKINYKDNRATLREVLLVFLLLNLGMFVTWIWFSVAGRRKVWMASFPDGAKSID